MMISCSRNLFLVGVPYDSRNQVLIPWIDLYIFCTVFVFKYWSSCIVDIWYRLIRWRYRWYTSRPKFLLEGCCFYENLHFLLSMVSRQEIWKHLPFVGRLKSAKKVVSMLYCDIHFPFYVQCSSKPIVRQSSSTNAIEK